MANEEISSLLLRVGIDYEAFEGFVNAMPEVVSVAENVGAALNATQIGNPELFRAKGEALSRALIAGIQAGALGLEFGGGSIAQQITNRVFGELDQAAAGRYVRDVQRLLDQVQLSVPQLTAPLVNQQSLQGLGQVAQMASGARRELEAMSGTLDGVVARLSALSAVRLPQTFVRRTADRTGLELTPSARRAAQVIGIEPPANARPGNVSGSSAEAGMQLLMARVREETALQRQQADLQRAIANGQRLVEASTRAPAISGPGQLGQLDLLSQALAAPARRVEQAGDRLARATESMARTAERAAAGLDTVTGKGELFSRSEVRTQAAQTRGQVDIFEAVAESQGASRSALARLASAEQARRSLGQKPLSDEQREEYLRDVRASEERSRTASRARSASSPLETFFHGTTSSNGLKILDEGLRANDIGAVYLAETRELAEKYARQRAELDAPFPGAIAEVQYDRSQLRQTSIPGALVAFTGAEGIPASAIKDVQELAHLQSAGLRDAISKTLERADLDAALSTSEERRKERIKAVYSAGPLDEYGEQLFRAKNPITGLDVGYMNTARPGRFSQVTGIAVEPEFRGQGIAQGMWRFAQEFRRDEALARGINPFINQIIHDPSRTEDGEAFARRAGGFALGRDRGLNLMTPFGEVPFPDAALPNYARRRFSDQLALPAGNGEGAVDFTSRLDRIFQRFGDRLGYFDGALGLRQDFTPIDPRTVQPPIQPPTRAELERFTKETNRQILDANARARAGSARAGDPADADAATLDAALYRQGTRRAGKGERQRLVNQRADSFEQMLLGRGLQQVDALRLSEEQLSALAGSQTGPQEVRAAGGRFFPQGLISIDDARRELERQQTDPNLRQPRTLASRADLEASRRRQAALELEARAARDLARDLSLLNRQLAITSGPLGNARSRLALAALGTAGTDPIALGGLFGAAGGIAGAPGIGPRNRVVESLSLEARTAASQQFIAEASYLRNIAATRRLDEALARLAVQLEATARAADPLSSLGTLRSIGVNAPQGLGLSGLPGFTSAFGVGSPLDPRLRDAIAAQSAGPSSIFGSTPLGSLFPDRPSISRQALQARLAEERPPVAPSIRSRLGSVPVGDPLKLAESILATAQRNIARLTAAGAGPDLLAPFQRTAAQATEQLRLLSGAAAAAGGGGARGGGGAGGGGIGGGGGGPFVPGGSPFPPSGGGGQSRFGQARSFVKARFGDEDTFLGGVRLGFSGGDDGGPGFFGRSVGQAARFSLVYGAAYSALRLFSGAFGEGVRGAIEFETALTDLNIATERTGRSNENFAFELSNLGAGRGFAPGESVAAGARAVGLFGATDSSRAEQEQIATVSTDVATKIAFISGQTLEQVQTQLAGITRSFNVDPLQQERIFDVASFVGRRTGRPAGELLQSLGQIGSLGGDAGFSLEQTAAIIARLTSTTGQTPQAVSGFLSQVLSRADDPRLQQKLRQVGVDTEGTTLAQQIEQLSGLGLPQDQTNRIIAGFGRGRSGQALGIILEQFPEIQKLAGGAAGAQGLGDRDFQQAVNTVGGQLRVLGSSLKDLFTGLTSTGILDVFVLLLSAAQGLVDALDAVVDVFNLIPREARSVAFMLLEVYGALLLLSKIPVVNGLAATALLNRGGQVIPGPRGAAAGSRLDPESSRRARAGAVGSLLTGAAGTGLASVGGLVGGGALAGGLLLGAGAAAALVGVGIWKAFSEAAAVDREFLEARQSVFGATTKEDFDAAKVEVEQAKRAAAERDDFKLLSKDVFTLGAVNIFNDIRGVGKREKAEADALEAERVEREKAVADARKLAVDTSPGAAFQGFDAGTESLSQGLTVLGERGFTATRQLDALNQAFDAVASKSADAAGGALIFAGQIDAFSIESTAGLTNTGNDFAKALAEGSALRAGGRARETLLEQNPLVALSAAFPTSVAGAFGRAAGTEGNFFTRKIPAFVAGGGDALVDVFQEFNPFGESDREGEERTRRGAAEINRVLGDKGVQEDLSGVINEVLVAQGKDPSLGPVVITDADREKISAKRKEILEAKLGKPFEELDKATQDAFYAELDKDLAETLAAYNGEKVTAETAAVFLQGVRQLAPQAGEEETLRTGDQLAGAALTTQVLRDARATATQTLADPAASEQDKAAAIRLMEVLDLDILRAVQGEVSKRNARIDAIAGLAASQFGGDPLQGASIQIEALRAKLQGTTDVDEQRALQAELNNQGFALRRAQVSSRSAQDLAGIDPRNVTANAEAGVRNAQRQLAIAIPGTEAYYTAVRGLLEAQIAFADAQVTGDLQVALSKLSVQDEVGRAEAELNAARARRANLDKGFAATTLNDFDTQGNLVGSVDLVAKGEGVGSQIVKGLLQENYVGAGSGVGRQLISGVYSALAQFGSPNAIDRSNSTYLEGGQATFGSPNAIDRGGSSGATTSVPFAFQSPSTAVLAGRQGTVSTGGSLATSGRFAPTPGQLTLGNRALIDLIVGSGAAFGRLDGNIVPRATADGGISSHSFGNALDIFGTPQELAALTKQLTPLAGNGLKELIYTPTGTFLGKGGNAFTPSTNVRANHNDHIHAQVDDPDAIRGLVAGDPRFANVRVGTSTAEKAAADLAIQQAERDRILAIQARDIAKLNSTLDPRNSLDRARADLQIANRILRDASGAKGTREYYEALTGVRQAQVALARAEADRAYAQDRAGAVRAQSPLAAAASALRTATDRVKKEVPRTKEYYDAVADLYRAQQDFAQATREAQATSLRLAGDITDPVAQAAIDLRIARAKVADVKRLGGDKNAIAAAELEAKQAETNLEQVAFDQRLNRARTDAELGRTSQQTYLQFLRDEEARLGAIAKRTQQQQNQYDQVQRELQNLNKQLTGQFNIGDIDVPTPYDARRLFTQKQQAEQALREQVAGFFDGLIFKTNVGGDPALAQASVAGATTGIVGSTLTNSNNVTTINISGGDLNQVKAVLDQYLGAAALQRTSISTVKV